MDEELSQPRRFKGKKKPPGWKGQKRSRARKGICCGAFSRRTGRECRMLPVRPGGRCRLHGGLNTGPASPEGKRAVGDAQREGWKRWRAEMGLPEDWRYGSTWLSRRKRETAADWLAKHRPELFEGEEEER
jgi:hypothetical protein